MFAIFGAMLMHCNCIYFCLLMNFQKYLLHWITWLSVSYYTHESYIDSKQVNPINMNPRAYIFWTWIITWILIRSDKSQFIMMNVDSFWWITSCPQTLCSHAFFCQLCVANHYCFIILIYDFNLELFWGSYIIYFCICLHMSPVYT
jgi:hypothetical protein